MLVQDELRLEYSVLLVAELQAHGGSVLVGLVLMWCIADEVQVIELAVHPKFQRQGIGLALMTKALNVGTRSHSHQLALVLRSHPQAAWVTQRASGTLFHSTWV